MTESHFRSIIKGISWRIVGTIDTMIISFFLTGHLHMALKIGVTEVLTKVFLYYLHERVWIYGLKGKDQTPVISFVKAVTWRTVGTIDTMLLGWFYSGNAMTGLKIGLTEVLTKIILYYLHERVWHKIPLGTVRKWFGIKSSE
ncbi:MAG: DUF2061 domain-containing protein [Chitinophagales bacterium]|jgi:uncharacterized membrane protein|nr:DUF2061 domain-containing protein [Chitinophagales bacterium]